ncbi:MAG: SusC/RagA family TonB-linked outer membrane protein [Bacteroidaceae bacterium]|nr:SusC/RagA family TonB-linked outer membrane protein [Bacteroidaceae bacterium]
MRKNYWLCKTFLLAAIGLCSVATTGYASPDAPSVLGIEQQKTIQVVGTVEDSNGVPLPGVNVTVKGTTNGTITDENGKFRLSVPAGATLSITYIGYASQEVKAKPKMEITMSEDAELLSEVIVTGVARGTSREKLSFNVEKVQKTALKEVTGTTVAATLNGKMPGIKILPTSGDPNSEPIIQLRGALSFASTDQPLIIIDGIVTGGSLKDINMEDVENIEVVKGAAAASFYGAKAAAGVISITTKRGSGLDNGQVDVSFKSELGASWIGFVPERTTAHGHVIDASGNITGTMEADQIWDNKYDMSHDAFDDFFVTRFFHTNTLSLTGRSKSGDINYYASITNTKNPGIVKMLEGVNRTSFRANMDAKLSDKLTLSTSNMYVRSHSDNRSINFDDIYYADPNADFNAVNLDGSPYKVNPNIVSTRNNINPLYTVANTRAEGTSNRFLGAYALRYQPFEWLSLNANYSIDFSHSYSYYLNPKGNLKVDSPDGTNRETGSISTSSSDDFKHNLEVGALFTKKFGDFNTSLKLQYLYEDDKYESVYGAGSKLAVGGMDNISLELADPETLDINSYGQRIVSNSYTAVFQGDYKDTYMFDALVRRDGASVIGDDNMWNTYYRISGAWNIAKTFEIKGIDLLKPRVSYGTAGILPAYGAKYEVYSMSAGSLYGAEQMGNSKLKAALSQELEIGLDVRFLKRFDLALTYSHKRNTDLPYVMAVSGITGFSYQNVNLGEFFVQSYEATLNANLIQKKDMAWDVTLTWDKMHQKVGELGRPNFTSGNMKINSNETYGKVYGTKFATSLDQVATHKDIKPGQSVEDVFTINNYGYVVRKDRIGTTEETHMYVLDENGNNKRGYIGNINPDFNMNMTNTFTWKNLTFYFTMSWQQGGLLFNNTKQYMSFAGRNAKFWDMSDRVWAHRKAYSYTNQHPTASFFEDATFLKMREMALNYRFNKNQLRAVGLDFLRGVKIGIIGRNLFTLTEFSGPDPETRTVEGGVLNGIETPKYPSDIRTVTGTITIDF